MSDSKYEVRRFFGSKSLLVIDDEIEMLETLKRRFRRYKVNVDGFSDSRLAMKELNTPLLEEYACVLTDIMMPGVTGDVIVSRIYELAPEIPVVVYSGYASRDVFDRAKQSPNVVGVIEKPFDFGKMCETMVKGHLKNTRTLLF